jgi:uncharacterized membrane protein
MLKKISRFSPQILATFLSFTGVAHFIVRDRFNPLIPPWLPGNATFYTYASGVAELAVAIGLFIPRTRRLAGSGAVLLFLSVYPGNIYMAYDWRDRDFSQQLVAYLRLPFQIPLIWWAVSIARKTPRE